MRKGRSLLFLLALLPFFFLHAQGSQLSGVITYEQIIDYQLEGAYNDSSWDNYIADLPKTGKSVHQLFFTGQEALYKEDPSFRSAVSSKLKTALMKANYAKNPQPIVHKYHFDFEEGYLTEETEFMTRTFLVEKVLKANPWKLISQKKKVLDYVCMGANLELGKEKITAWFTPQLPISIGPGPYTGLPGIILGLEKEGEVFLLATKIELKNLDDLNLKEALGRGQKVSLEKFESTRIEKVKEHIEQKAIKDSDHKKGKN